jgi:hypothetical protein
MSATTTRTHDGVDEESNAAPAGKVTDTAAQFVPGMRRSFTEERRRSRRRSRIVKFAVCVPLWALCAVPLAREIADRGGGDAILAYLAVAAVSLGIAAAIRGVYVLVTKRTLLSPVVFVLASVLAIASYGVQTAGEPEPSVVGAVVQTLELQQTL